MYKALRDRMMIPQRVIAVRYEAISMLYRAH